MKVMKIEKYFKEAGKGNPYYVVAKYLVNLYPTCSNLEDRKYS
jgi:hypothetical protein